MPGKKEPTDRRRTRPVGTSLSQSCRFFWVRDFAAERIQHSKEGAERHFRVARTSCFRTVGFPIARALAMLAPGRQARALGHVNV